jgi:hypothetical protein
MADQEDTRQQLENAQAQIRKAEVEDDSDRELLGQIDAGLQTILSGEQPLPGPDHPLTERVSEAIERFEASHPTLWINEGV